MRGVIYQLKTMGWRYWLAENWFGLRNDLSRWWDATRPGAPRHR